MSNLQLAKNLRTLRKEHKLTQTHLSALLNISRQAYSNYENCKRTPDLESLIHLSDIYSISLDDLVNKNLGAFIAEQKTPYLPALNIRTGDALHLTDEEVDLVMKFRDMTEENRIILKGFLDSQSR